VTVVSSRSGELEQPEDLVTLQIDGYTVQVPPGTLVIRAAEQIGVEVPRFCDHPLLEPVGACRQCLVEIGSPDPRSGELRWMPKPQASCTIPVSEGMHVRTQVTSATAEKAQQGIMEFLLMNHPLDCPICDKGGECPLQNQAMSAGRPESRFDGVKRTYPKPLPISSEVLLDRERCVLCARCTRFSDQIAGDPFIELLERGADQQVGIGEGEPFSSYFSGNTIQICPVGALTSQTYRFRARPFDLVSTDSACEHCASGCSLRTDHRRGKVMRRLAGVDMEVNEEWSCDKGRFAFTYADTGDRIEHPLVRDKLDGELHPASWPEALALVAERLQGAARSAVLTGGRLTLEDAYAYSKFARVALGTNDIDFRARHHTEEEAEFLASAVVMTGTDHLAYRDLEQAPVTLLVGLEPEEESPIVFLRLRKGARRGRTRVVTLAPFASQGSTKMSAEVLACVPGQEAALLDMLSGEGAEDASVGSTGAADLDALREQLAEPGSVILVGERLAQVPGAFSAALRLVTTTGARLGWVPRRAGERGALDAGALPLLLPGGRPVAEAEARVDVAAAWDVDSLPSQRGRDATAILGAVGAGVVEALVVAGVELADLPDPTAAREALAAGQFVVSLEIRHSDVTEFADVVLPVAPVAEKAGTFVNWEGRARSFEAALTDSTARSDGWVLDAVAAAMGHRLGVADVAAVRAELAELGGWTGARHRSPDAPGRRPEEVSDGEAVLSTWRMLLDDGRGQDGEPHLAGTAREPVARVSHATAAKVGVASGGVLTIASTHGSMSLPVAECDMPDDVVWVPQNSVGTRVQVALAAAAGDIVTLSARGSA
jgi:NADH-quinone oxidoreductase subunit G